MLHTGLHLILHILTPAAAARIGFPGRWQRAWLVMTGTMIVDLDHLLADPVFDPERCSLGFHPLHTWPAVALYALLTVGARTRLVGLGLLIHMALDGMDCLWM